MNGYQWHFFFLGAGFMLVEFHNLSRLAVIFGTTWYVNIWVISGILAMILAANLAVARVRWLTVRFGYSAVLVSLAIAYAVPVASLMAWPKLAGSIAAVGLLSLPVFFAGIAFGRSFADEPNRAVAFGSNFLGTIVGGVAENLSFTWGVRSLMLVAFVFYACAALCSLRRRGSPPGDARAKRHRTLRLSRTVP